MMGWLLVLEELRCWWFHCLEKSVDLRMLDAIVLM